MIISDDQAWTDYGFMGHPRIETPRLDQLARESVTFTRGYVPTSLCRPSLATLVSGLYPHHHGITGNDPAIPEGLAGNPRHSIDYLDTCETLISRIDAIETLPDRLAEAGYLSFQSGKWWEGHHARGGFTHGMTHGDPSRGGRHGDEGLTIGREGLQPLFDFVDEAGGRPFFIWYAPFLPHTPHDPPPRLLEKYADESTPEPLARYHAMCEWFDESCGQLLDGLENRGLTENTIVIYVTDNGWIQRTAETPVPEGWRTSFAPGSKQSPHEGGIRTPIMIRWPALLQPRLDEATLVSSLDLMPTVLEACGLEPQGELPGRSLLGLCRGRPLDRDVIFGEIFAHDIADLEDPQASLLYRWCISGRWKLIVYHPGQLGRYRAIHHRDDFSPRLYDLLEDPHETRDRSADHPEIVEQLQRRIDSWWRLEN